MGIGTGLARAYTGAQSIARQREEAEAAKREQAMMQQLQMAALEAGLRGQGVLPETEAADTPVDFTVPGGVGGDFALPMQSRAVLPEAARYERLGNTGRVRDTLNTPDAKARVQQALQQRQRQQEQEAQRRQQLLLERERRQAEAEARKQSALEARETHQANRRFDIANPLPTTERFTFLPGLDEQGKPVVARGNTRTGEVAATNVGRPASAGGARQSFQERATGAMMGEVEAANALLAKYSDPTAWSQLTKGGLFRNYANTPEGRQFNQAAEHFLTQTAFALSGKTVRKDELERLKSVYIPQPGDDPATLQQKAEARASRVQAMAKLGGVQQHAPSTDARGIEVDIDAMIRAGKTNEEIKAALRARGGH